MLIFRYFLKKHKKRIAGIWGQSKAFPDWYAITLLNEVIVPCALDGSE